MQENIISQMNDLIKHLPHSKKLQLINELKNHIVESNQAVLEAYILTEKEFTKRGFHKTDNGLREVLYFRGIIESCKS